jgi:acetate kinase
VISWLNSHPDLGSIDAVGHRVVHGGDKFKSAVRIDDVVIESLNALCDLAPLHNPSSVSGIHAARKVLGTQVPMVAAFDTSFHQTIPEPAAIYALPYDLSTKHRIRRYGFHGLAHQYSATRYGELTGKAADQINIVTLHLGNGCSACAIRNGLSIDTSMGFTPLEGLVMGSRSGDLDPALVAHLARQEGIDEVENLLNTRSGLIGLSGISSDMRELIAVYKENPRARLAIDVFCYRARKYLGAYLAALQGADAVVFSGGIGEHIPLVRREICAGMEWCGLVLNEHQNDSVIGSEERISTAQARIQVFVIPSDEEAVITHQTAMLLQ